MKFKTCLLLIWLTAISLSSSAQNKNDSTVLVNATSSLSNYFVNHPIEKVYLHLDKPYYIPGDTIWFKAYTVIGNMHQLSALSGVLYCELINNKDSVVSRHILKLIVGLSWGDFALPRQLAAGDYHIRAYTNWMRNAGADYFYDQRVKIGGTGSLSTSTNATAQLKPDIQFFPEGGQMVNGVRSKIAVKCVNPNGLGVDMTGSITDNDGNEVATFATQHLGMGIFALIPQQGKTYKAHVTGPDSAKYTVDLPAAQEQGFTLAVNSNNADSIYLKVAANDKLFQLKQNSSFYVVAQSGGRVFYTAQGKLAAPVFTTQLAKSRFPSGIVQFTLFSQEGEPLNERVIFIQNDDTLKLKLSLPSQTYSARQKLSINLSTINTGAVSQGSYSVSVINESRVPVNENDESTILSNLLLTSDLKGYIEQPGYYFNSINDQTQADLDVLMLTQGYRRFEWKQVLNNAGSMAVYQPEKMLSLIGSIKTPSGAMVPNGKITMMASRENFLADTVTDAAGNFKFDNIALSDTAKVILRARKQHNGANVAIYVKQPGYPAVVKNQINTDTATTLTPVMLQNLAAYKARLKDDSLANRHQLKEVVIKDKVTPKPDQYNNYGTSLEYDANMKTLNSEYNYLSQALAMLIPGASYLNGKIRYDGGPAVLYIDDMRHTTDDIDLYTPVEIDNVRMISATGTRPALLMVTTKRFAGSDTASTVLKEVVIKDRRTVRQGPDLSGSSNLNGPGHADQVILGNTLDGCITLSDCLNGKVFGVTFKDGAPYSTRAQGRISGSGPMTIIVDGNIMTGDHLDDLNANDIYSIEVLRSGAYLAVYGSNTPTGALVITTKHSSSMDYITSASPEGLINYPFKGFTKAHVFYSPKYDGPRTDAQGPDLRSTIYWNPNIITDKDGKASFEYYNADTKGTYRIVVEGINDTGSIGRAVYKYKVE